MSKLYFYNNFHYGDCLVSLHFLNHLTKVNDIQCEFMCLQPYHWQLQEFICDSDRIKLTALPQESFNAFDFRTHRNPNNAINLWCCPSIRRLWGEDHKTFPTYSKNFPHLLDVGLMVYEIWKYVCETNNLIYPFKDKNDTIFDQPILEQDTLVKDYDFLLVNSYCNSGQMKISPQQQDSVFLQVIDYLKVKNKSFITTHKLLDNECTYDYNLSLAKIGQLSKRCKVVFGVPTAPFWATVNKWAMNNCIKYVNFTNDKVGYDFNDKMTNISDLDALSKEITELVEKI